MSLFNIATISSGGTVDWALELDFDNAVDKLSLIDAKDKTVLKVYNLNTLSSISFKFKESSDGSGGTVLAMDELTAMTGTVSFKTELDTSADISSLFLNSSDLDGIVLIVLEDDIVFALTGTVVRIKDGAQIRISVDGTNDKLVIEVAQP
ncbi:MAG: hypothetical protein DHS20C18_25030 [Saprospiraceae bacterium]|nr:MAG: hypothetical protein DHS20C18_25030 [Saprospiraceae bacterium]